MRKVTTRRNSQRNKQIAGRKPGSTYLPREPADAEFVRIDRPVEVEPPVPKMIIPTEWTFESANIASNFEDHVREQLPWYDMASRMVAHIVRHYLPVRGRVIDVGAGTGNIGRALDELLEARSALFTALEPSQAMRDVYQGPGALLDTRMEDFAFHAHRSDVIIAFLALMFVAPKDRANLLTRMKNAIEPGGALIVFDKTECPDGYLGTIVHRLTLAAKWDAGAPIPNIMEKELSIAGRQRPMARCELKDFVEVFRFGAFAGWVYEQPII